MGAPPDYAGQEAGREDWAHPREDPEENGCPGAWYRTAFVESVLRYRRRPVGEGQRVPNRHLDTCDDWLVVDAVEVLEAHEDAWEAERQRAMYARLKRADRAD